MGSIYSELLEQLTAIPQDQEESRILVCDCSRGEMVFDALESHVYISSRQCNPGGVCAFVARAKHRAKANSLDFQKSKLFQDNLKGGELEVTQNANAWDNPRRNDHQTPHGQKFVKLTKFLK